MAFFDKLAASVSKTAKEVSEGARTLADKNRIRKDIDAIENELTSRFREIGEKCFNEGADSPAPEYEELFKAVKELKAALEAKQRELDALNGAGLCPNCGKPIAKDAKFCASCGATIPEAPAPAQAPTPHTTPMCRNCGAPLSQEAAFCAVCGTKVEKKEEAPAEAPKKNVCPNCGEILPDGALFCAVCGTKAPDVD